MYAGHVRLSTPHGHYAPLSPRAMSSCTGWNLRRAACRPAHQAADRGCPLLPEYAQYRFFSSAGVQSPFLLPRSLPCPEVYPIYRPLYVRGHNAASPVRGEATRLIPPPFPALPARIPCISAGYDGARKHCADIILRYPP